MCPIKTSQSSGARNAAAIDARTPASTVSVSFTSKLGYIAAPARNVAFTSKSSLHVSSPLIAIRRPFALNCSIKLSSPSVVPPNDALASINVGNPPVSNPFNRCCVVVGASAMNLNTIPRPRSFVASSHRLPPPYRLALGSFNRRRASSPSSLVAVVQSCRAPSTTSTTALSTIARAASGLAVALDGDSTRASRNPDANSRSAVNFIAVASVHARVRRAVDASRR
mmetsp:Transcript_2667/g.10301  ORF Transcript_2667/g.10301 Transcript_2667/m.10301 type:complete len:225 (+) Transcript_2667:1501-2175(+)